MDWNNHPPVWLVTTAFLLYASLVACLCGAAVALMIGLV